MTSARPVGVVVDTMVISWLLYERPGPVADRYRALIGTKTVLLAFQTVMELRYGALRAGWGELRRRRLERRIAELTVVQPDDQMISDCAELHQRCRPTGHPLGDKVLAGDPVQVGDQLLLRDLLRPGPSGWCRSGRGRRRPGRAGRPSR